MTKTDEDDLRLAINECAVAAQTIATGLTTFVLGDTIPTAAQAEQCWTDVLALAVALQEIRRGLDEANTMVP